MHCDTPITLVDPLTVDIMLKVPAEPVLEILTAPGFGILYRKTAKAQIQLARDPHSWHGTSPCARVVVRHMPDSAAQLLAVQRGDVAFNLTPKQTGSLKAEKQIYLGLRAQASGQELHALPLRSLSERIVVLKALRSQNAA